MAIGTLFFTIVSSTFLSLFYCMLCIIELQITEHPQSNASIKWKENVTLTVSAIEAENLAYYWKKDGDDVSDSKYTGTTTPTLTIREFLPENQGSYSCLLMNNYDKSSIESHRADLALGKSL